MVNDALKDTLHIVASESEAEFKRLTRRRKKGELLYEPRKASLYVWELEITRHDQWMGGQSNHTWSNLYVTRDLAVMGACEEILRSYGSWREDERKKLKEQMATGKHEEALEEHMRYYQNLRFEIKSTEVRASSVPYEISEYKP